jgi:ankyrin repeat protein
MEPIQSTDNQYQVLSRLIAKENGKIKRILTRIEVLDGEMRETAESVSEYASCVLKTIKNVMEKHQLLGTTLNIQVVKQQIQEQLPNVLNNLLTDFDNLIDCRENYIENGRVLTLTPEAIQELRRKRIESITKMLEEAKKDLNITSEADLNALRLKLEKQDIQQQDLGSAILDKKTILTDLYTAALQRREDLVAQRASLFKGPDNQNVWSAIKSGDVQAVREAIDAFGFFGSLMGKKQEFLNQKNSEGQSLLHVAAIFDQDEIVRLLLQNQANVGVKDNEGYQPLHLAAKYGSLKAARVLLQSKSPTEAQGPYKRTPMHMAAHSGQVEVVKLLIEFGADINAAASSDDSNTTPLIEAVWKEHLNVVALLTDHPSLNVNLVDSRNHNALYIAIQIGRSDMAALIIVHPSWKMPTSDDPNHISKLLKINPPRNASQIRKALSRFSLDPEVVAKKDPNDSLPAQPAQPLEDDTYDRFKTEVSELFFMGKESLFNDVKELLKQIKHAEETDQKFEVDTYKQMGLQILRLLQEASSKESGLEEIFFNLWIRYQALQVDSPSKLDIEGHRILGTFNQFTNSNADRARLSHASSTINALMFLSRALRLSFAEEFELFNSNQPGGNLVDTIIESGGVLFGKIQAVRQRQIELLANQIEFGDDQASVFRLEIGGDIMPISEVPDIKKNYSLDLVESMKSRNLITENGQTTSAFFKSFLLDLSSKYQKGPLGAFLQCNGASYAVALFKKEGVFQFAVFDPYGSHLLNKEKAAYIYWDTDIDHVAEFLGHLIQFQKIFQYENLNKLRVHLFKPIPISSL